MDHGTTETNNADIDEICSNVFFHIQFIFHQIVGEETYISNVSKDINPDENVKYVVSMNNQSIQLFKILPVWFKNLDTYSKWMTGVTQNLKELSHSLSEVLGH